MRLLLILLIVTVSLPLHGQEETRSPAVFKAGAIAGLTITQIDGDGYAGWNKVGLTVGGFVNTRISRKNYLQMELLFVQKGSKNPSDPENGDFDFYDIRLNYVEVPVLFRRRFKRRFMAEGGLSLGVQVTRDESDISGPVAVSGFDFNRFELALHLGAEYAILKNTFVNARLSHSVLPISDEAIIDPSFGIIGGAYNQVITFSVRHQFLH
ncbi:MAG: porin family protein [Bacteroidota bacterium]